MPADEPSLLLRASYRESIFRKTLFYSRKYRVLFRKTPYARECPGKENTIPVKTAVIIGAGPAGLTAAFELLEKTDIKPVIFEMSSDIGGISKTVNYRGNRIDIGGHRFFSKSGRVMKWWMDMMPAEGGREGADPEKTNKVMLIRSRLSRIFYLKSFFSYPVSLSPDTVRNLGITRSFRILTSFACSMLFPVKNEKTLEDFLVNRFGRELYNTFFKDYTEKVWGVKCSDISAEWGAQRIKGLSVARTLSHAAGKLLGGSGDISQKGTETSLIERFLYPKFGPGQMWEETARQIRLKGGELHLNSRVKSLEIIGGKVKSVTVENEAGEEKVYEGDYFFSTMPVKDLIASIRGDVPPPEVRKTASGLPYRDFITAGILLKKLHVKTKRDKRVKTMVPDNWIYIQERDVKLGRLQVFNNWSPYMVKDPGTVWLGLEYFCNEGDVLWGKDDGEFAEFAIDELAKIDFIRKEDVLDSVVLRVPKTYPAYFGSYPDFKLIREYTDRIENLFLIGRNGMHKYNNADHSMLTAMAAVENIAAGRKTKDNIWSVNTEEDYHEEK